MGVKVSVSKPSISPVAPGDHAWFDKDQVLDPNAVVTLLVEAGLVRQHHAGFERRTAPVLAMRCGPS